MAIESQLDKSRVKFMVTSPDWTNIGVSFIFLTVNLFRHPSLIGH